MHSDAWIQLLIALIFSRCDFCQFIQVLINMSYSINYTATHGFNRPFPIVMVTWKLDQSSKLFFCTDLTLIIYLRFPNLSLFIANTVFSCMDIAFPSSFKNYTHISAYRVSLLNRGACASYKWHAIRGAISHFKQSSKSSFSKVNCDCKLRKKYIAT